MLCFRSTFTLQIPKVQFCFHSGWPHVCLVEWSVVFCFLGGSYEPHALCCHQFLIEMLWWRFFQPITVFTSSESAESDYLHFHWEFCHNWLTNTELWCMDNQTNKHKKQKISILFLHKMLSIIGHMMPQHTMLKVKVMLKTHRWN